MHLVLLLLLLPGAASQHALPCRANEEQCASSQGTSSQETLPCRQKDEQCALEEDEKLSVSLFQSSISIVPADPSTTDMGKVLAAQLQSGKQLHDELHLAKQARLNVLASLQQWDERIEALELRLTTSKHVEVPVMMQIRNVSLQSPPTLIDPGLYDYRLKNARMYSLCAAALGIVMFGVRTVLVHNTGCHKGGNDIEEDPLWYQCPQVTAKVLGAGGLLWLISGMIIFTEFMWFTDDHRHLTLIESMYLTTQIVTTVGYGDMTPKSSSGQVFMAFYALTGVGIIGTMIQQLALDGDKELEVLEEDIETEGKQPFFGQYHGVIMSVMPIVGCLAFGTVFFSQYPGENKTPFEAFYMSMITLLTIGFGAYHPVTQLGKLVAVFWMLIGVMVMGSAIGSAMKYARKMHFSIQAQARTVKLFHEIDVDGSGTIDRMEFLNFALVRQGVPNKTADQILAHFAKLDTDNSGSLDLKEFRSYVKTI